MITPEAEALDRINTINRERGNGPFAALNPHAFVEEAALVRAVEEIRALRKMLGTPGDME